MQKAADAAALAGAVFMPENMNGIAFTTAKSSRRRTATRTATNGVTVVGRRRATAEPAQGDDHREGGNVFGSRDRGRLDEPASRTRSASTSGPSAWGARSTSSATTRRARRSVHGSARYPDFWANIFGPSSQKAKGDAIQSTICGGADNCSGRATPTTTRTATSTPSTCSRLGSPLAVQAFDPEFAARRRQLRRQRQRQQPRRRGGAPGELQPEVPGHRCRRLATTRRRRARTAPATCTTPRATTCCPWTVYKLRAPDLTPGRPDRQPGHLLGRVPRLHGRPRGRAEGHNATGRRTGSVREVLPAVVHAVHGQQPGRRHLLPADRDEHQDQRDRRARSAAARTGSRCGPGSNGNLQSNAVRIYGDGRIGIYANSPAANTTFYLARVLPGAKGRTLVLNFFDVGDAAQAGAITVLPPTDSNVGGAFAGCTYTPPPGNSTGPPWGTFSRPTSTGCKITQRQQRQLQRPVDPDAHPDPDTYTCNYNDPFGCWIRVNFAFPAAVQDTTTWSAQLTRRSGPAHPVGVALRGNGRQRWGRRSTMSVAVLSCGSGRRLCESS